jgi:hypothetical protein
MSNLENIRIPHRNFSPPSEGERPLRSKDATPSVTTLGSVASTIGAMALEETLVSGKKITIPSLGITINNKPVKNER